MLSSAVLTQPQAPRPVANQVASPWKGPAPARSTVTTAVDWAAALELVVDVGPVEGEA